MMNRLHSICGAFVRPAAITFVVLAMSALSIFAQETASSIDNGVANGSAKSSSSTRHAPPASTGWTGLYVGGYVGANWGRSTANTSTVFSPTGYFAATSVPAIATAGRQNLNSTGFTGGGTLGYNYQSGIVVVGGEADFGAMTGKKTVNTTSPYPCCPTTNFTVTQSSKTNWVFTARPRFGFVAGHALLYITGGVAVTSQNYQALFTDTFATAHENGGISKARAGWTGGGGVEFMVGNQWSLKGEYLYANFGRQTTTSTNLTAPAATSWPTSVFTHSIFLTEHALRFGANYRF